MTTQKFNKSSIKINKESAEKNVEYLNSIGYTNTSSRIRFLLSEGYSRADVAKCLDKRYQHVRNVEITPIKKT